MNKPAEAQAPGAHCENARRWPIGAEISGSGTSFRVWAPGKQRVSVVVEGAGEHALAREADGYFSAEVPGIAEGARYWFRLGEDGPLLPDPASRFQPDGPHGPSQVVDPLRYRWRDSAWRGVSLPGQVLYEMHVGTFTPEGTWAAAASRLSQLKEIGITVLEMMPVAEFPGTFGWGYDGVDLFAPTRLYGTPDDLRAFVDTAHALGLGVILDVVYNHFGPDGCYLREFTPAYFTTRYENEWGEAINFDGELSEGVREFIRVNAGYWIDEFHFDGLRLDATQQIFDASEPHILAEVSEQTRRAAAGRDVILIAENEPQQTITVRPAEEGGYGLDALWNDDLHHSAVVALTGRNPAYYSDHLGRPQEFISAAKYGYLFQGQRYAWQKNPRGTPSLDLPAWRFVTFLQNHDQIANSAFGARIHRLTSPGRARAMTAFLLLAPGTPMLFQGQEFWASAPFLYFADHKPDLAQLVTTGRRAFLNQFPTVKTLGPLDTPSDQSTFEKSKLDWSEWGRHHNVVALHRDLLQLRRTDAVLAAPRRGSFDGAVLGDEAFLLRYFDSANGDRLLLVNLGRDLTPGSFAEPLIAPPAGCAWQLMWSSEDPRYGGCGTAPFENGKGYHLGGHAALLLRAGSP